MELHIFGIILITSLRDWNPYFSAVFFCWFYDTYSNPYEFNWWPEMAFEGTYTPSPWQLRPYPFYIVNTMAADALAPWIIWAPGAMVLAQFARQVQKMVTTDY